MYIYRFGGRHGTAIEVDVADDLVVVRTKARRRLYDAVQSSEGRHLLGRLTPMIEFREAGVSVLECRSAPQHIPQLRDRARHVLRGEPDIRFAGRALRDRATSAPVVYTENFFVKFRDDLDDEACRALLSEHALQVKRPLGYARNAYFVAADEGTGLDVFRIATELLGDARVDLAHPEIVREAAHRNIAPTQWHLHPAQIGGRTVEAHINVIEAWETSRGRGITIAVIDDGVDTDHPEFEGKIVAPRDVTRRIDDATPKLNNDNHGTACAGVACASGQQASGVAPEARLMPIRLRSELGSQAEADAFAWATEHGADVISCSWGPADGRWWDAHDVRHRQRVAMSDSTRLAVEYAIANGREGKGCVICWAAGNGNESVDNDGYASHPSVMAVAACNDRGERSVYSDFGDAIWCAFPSNDFAYSPYNHPQPLTEGIWTTDREGSAGYNAGALDPSGDRPPGDDKGHYTGDFGGTSSACPGVAGIAALVLEADPSLRWDDVRTLIRRSCQPIDADGGTYDADGRSPDYGYGRPNAGEAVRLARAGREVAPEPLALRATARGSLDGDGAARVYVVDLPAKARIHLDGPEGEDFDLYLRKDAPPTTDAYDQRGYTPTADESLRVVAGVPGRYFVLVRSYRGTGTYDLTVELESS